jgi:DNA primase
MSGPRLSFAEVKAVAQARILDVLAALGIHQRPRGGYLSMCSPVVPDKHPSFTIWTRGPAAGCFKDFRGLGQGDIFDLVALMLGYSAGNDRQGRGEALAFLADRLGLARMADAEREAYARALAEHRRLAPSVDEEDERRTSKAIALRRECRSIGGTEAEEYFRRRGIRGELPSCLWFHPHLYCEGDYWPALVADITDITGKLIGVHRTFLRPDGSGKAPIADAKRALGRVAGGAVRLRMPVADTCGVAEGIETALSAQELFKLPVFAACGSNLAGVAFPRNVRRAVIFGDRGGPGEKAVRDARVAFQQRGLLVLERLPPVPSKDWNDELVRLQSLNSGSTTTR